MTDVTDEKLDELKHELEGTCQTLDTLIEAHSLDMDADELEDRLLDGASPVERCASCEWWFRSTDLESVEGRPLCDSCLEDEDDE